jgi:hypothetical protein
MLLDLARALALALATAGETPAAAADDLDALFAAALPPRAESRWTLIPWRDSLTDALAEARTARKPLYLHVNDGDVGSGRC